MSFQAVVLIKGVDYKQTVYCKVKSEHRRYVPHVQDVHICYIGENLNVDAVLYEGH